MISLTHRSISCCRCPWDMQQSPWHISARCHTACCRCLLLPAAVLCKTPRNGICHPKRSSLLLLARRPSMELGMHAFAC